MLLLRITQPLPAKSLSWEETAAWNHCISIYIFFGEDDDDDGDDYDDVDIDDDLDLVTKLLQIELNCFRKNLNLT